MKDVKDEAIRQVDNNLRFVITISIFFLSVFSEARLAGCIIIVFYIINYIIFQIKAKKLTPLNLKYINWSLLVGIGSYVIPFSVIAFSTQNITLSKLSLQTWQISLIGSMWIIMCAPIVTLLMILFFQTRILGTIKK
jgi:hypothetical protein